MSLINNAFKRLYQFRAARPSKHNIKADRWHKCRIEQMEARQLLSATPINLGAVYVEVGKGDDLTGDIFTVSFSGGAEGTKLTNLTINLHDVKTTSDYCFFDGSSINVIVNSDNNGEYVGSSDIGGVSIGDGSSGRPTTLTISSISNFTENKKLVFTIDVDEYNPGNNPPINQLAEADEITSNSNATIFAAFTAHHYKDASLTAVFANDRNYSTSLALPDDNYSINLVDGFPANSETRWDCTADAFNTTNQTLLPVTISGHVYFDSDLDNQFEPTDTDYGLGGFAVTLYRRNEAGGYDLVNSTTTADSSGYYSFTTDAHGLSLSPGTYQIVKTPIKEYLDVGASLGDVEGNGVSGAISADYNMLSGITLEGGDNCANNDFAENAPATISGHVYYDKNNNGTFDSNESLITETTTIELLDSNGNVIDQINITDGNYEFTGLTPGTYSIRESTQPAGYSDGTDAAGTVDGKLKGTPLNPGDLISDIDVTYGSIGTDYDFGEIKPATISGKVFVSNNNATYELGETLLSGVTVRLCKFDSKTDSVTQIAATTTDLNGYYSFTIDFLDASGKEIKVTDANGDSVNYSSDSTIVFGVVELETADNYILWKGTKYFEGGDIIGSINSVADANASLNGVDRIDKVSLGIGDVGTEYDFYEVEPATISGYVFQDGATISVKDTSATPDLKALGYTGTLTSDDTRLAGVTLQLCDGGGYPRVDANGDAITATTDSNGYYEFKNLYPNDTYSIKMITSSLPDGCLTGIDTPGSLGGRVVNKYSGITAAQLSALGVYGVTASGDAIVQIALAPGDAATQNNFSVVKVATQPPIHPPVFPNPPPTISDLPHSPIMPDPLIYGVSYTFPPIVMPQQLMGGSSGPPGYTWHLSVIDGGQPRQLQNGEFAANSQAQLFDPETWTGADLNQGGLWIIADANGVPVKKYRFGLPGATPVTGDWNGDGVSKIGVFINGLWFLDLNGDGIWDENDLWAKLGQQGDRPVSGDWDGDGKTDIGIFGPAWFGDPRALSVESGLPDAKNPSKNHYKNIPPDPEDATIGWRTMKRTSAGNLRSDLIDHVFRFGSEDDRPVAGDWNGDGVYAIGIFRNGTWFLDMDGDGRWSPGDVVVEFGQEGDIPVVGDWTGDGISKLGVYRNGTFYLDTNNNHVLDATDKVFALGSPGDKPFAGDFTGSGVDTVGVYHDGAETVAAPAPTPAAAPAD